MRLIDFCRKSWPHTWHVNWHHELICENLELLERGEIPNLMLWAPPRHGKSDIASVRYPAHCLLNDPHAKFICATHADDLARSAARATRDLILSPACQSEAPYKLKVAGDSKWMLDFPGSNARHSYIGVSIEGQLTGEGCTRLLADDLLKGAAEAWSQTIRDKVWQAYLTAAETRLAPGGRQVIMATRWHLDDPCGRLITRALENPLASQWRVLALAATNDDAQSSYIWDTWKPQPEAMTFLPTYHALWPRQFPRDVLDQKKANLLPSHWSSLYQQNPLSAEDQMFPADCWKSYDNLNLGEIEYVVSSWDLANKTSERNDYSVNVVLAHLASGIYVVLDVWRDRVAFDALPQIVLARFYAQVKRYNNFPLMVIEDAAAGTQMIQIVRSSHPEIPLLEARPTNAKPVRAMGITHLVRGGLVWLPREAGWRDTFVAELAQFPLARFDDQVDAFVHGMKAFYTGDDFRTPDMKILPGPMNATSEHEARIRAELEWRSLSISPDIDEFERQIGIGEDW
jgi:predicted phage terminase large subunit-like protein